MVDRKLMTKSKHPGKVVISDLYIHRDAVELLSDEHRTVITDALSCAPEIAQERANVIKLNQRTGRVSLLAYPDFFDDPFPALAECWIIEQESAAPPSYRSYTESLNPPILHRKELLLPFDNPARIAFAAITKQAEEFGLFDDTTTIGFRLNWQRLIASKGYRLEGNQFVPLGNVDPDNA
jgi:DNA phosphorothioation-associated putative methyltransferase